jgi:multidrug resistance efflux pump
MAGNVMRKDSDKAASDVTRARRRAAFIATIRHASQVDAPAARPATRKPAARPASAEAPGPARWYPHMRAVAERAPEPALATIAEPWAAKFLVPREEPLPPARPSDRKRTSEIGAVEDGPRRPRASAQVVKAPATAEPDPGLFRADALKHRLSSEEGRGLVRVSPPWTWALLWIVVIGIGAALTASFVGKFEVTGRGRGILRPTTGVRALTSQITGTVVRVDARSGDRVKAGTALIRIESATVQGQLLEAERELEAVRTRFATAASQQDQHYEEQIQSLEARSSRLSDQIASLKSSEAHFKRRVDADLGLLRKGLVSELALSETRDALAQAQRQLSGAEQALDQTRQELASLESRRQDELWQRQQTVSAAQNKRDALALVSKQSVIEAPENGTVEALLVREGETVQAGQNVGKVVPVEAPLQVVSFLAEKDRAFAKVGDEVELELDQLPHAEYGTLKAKVARIGDDLTSPTEVQDALGEGQKLELPSYRVELEITDSQAAEAAGVKLRTGTLLNARFTLRRQRLITLVLNPLRKWFQ